MHDHDREAADRRADPYADPQEELDRLADEDADRREELERELDAQEEASALEELELRQRAGFPVVDGRHPSAAQHRAAAAELERLLELDRKVAASFRGIDDPIAQDVADRLDPDLYERRAAERRLVAARYARIRRITDGTIIVLILAVVLWLALDAGLPHT